MSIYISLVTLEDSDITHTILSAIDGADNAKDITIGVAAAVSDEFYDEHLAILEGIPRLIINRVSKFDVRGVAKGRYLSRFAYNDQDYILQVDSHTLFTKHWDTKLIATYKDALNTTQNNKTILTAYLGPHQREGDKFNILGNDSRYCVFTPKQISPLIRINSWVDIPLNKFPIELEPITDKFVPAIKVGAHFIFGNREFAKFSGLPREALFYDEEMMQTINLLENGFALVFPNMQLPLTHRYINEKNITRETGIDLYSPEEDPTLMMTRIIYDFIENNGDACDRYHEYSKYDLKTGMVRPFHIPKTFGYV